jgi:signal transduction histidine kinase
VIQSLYAIGMQLQLMRATRHVQPDGLLPVMQNLNNVIEDIRGYIQNLKSQSFQQKTIAESLHDMTNRLQVPADLRVEIDAPDSPMPFLPTTYEALSQMANEALSNVFRHAGATEVRLTARQHNSTFELEIADNGRGFEVQHASDQSGLGLRNIQQRARLHGGNVTIDSHPGGGTRIVFSLPVNV